ALLPAPSGPGPRHRPFSRRYRGGAAAGRGAAGAGLGPLPAGLCARHSRRPRQGRYRRPLHKGRRRVLYRARLAGKRARLSARRLIGLSALKARSYSPRWMSKGPMAWVVAMSWILLTLTCSGSEVAQKMDSAMSSAVMGLVPA